jgi:hypothetical protein
MRMIDARGVERRRPALQPVNAIALGQQEVGEIGPVLAGYSGDQGDLSAVGCRHGSP